MFIGGLMGFGIGYLTGMDYEKHNRNNKKDINKDNKNK